MRATVAGSRAARGERMSGFAGIYDITGAPVERNVLARMLARVAYRGADAQDLWLEESVGLGCCLRRITPESSQETQPLIDAQRNCVIVFDGRIDNRAELLSLFGITPEAACTMADAALVLHAYDRWAMQCPVHLIGEFAAAIWDARRQRLFCFRDALGVAPFYYHWNGRCLVLASAIKALFEAAAIPRRINESMIAEDLLSDYRFDYREAEGTYFDAVKQLRPAHSLCIERGRLTTTRYWDIKASVQHASLRDETYYEQFEALFREAVRARMRSSHPVAVALSGGIDSTLVTATAEMLRRNLPAATALHAFTIPAGGIYQEEWDAIHKLVEWYGTSLEIIPPPQEPSSLLELFLCESETPHHVGFCNVLAFYRAIQSKGCRSMLTGFGADELVASGEQGVLEDLLWSGHWAALAREIRRKAWAGRDTFAAVAAELLNDQMPPKFRWLIRRMRGLHVPAWIDASFAARTGMQKQQPPAIRRFPSRCQTHTYRALTAPGIAHTLNQAGDIAAQFGIEWSYPYLDRRLVEWMFTVPMPVHRRAGYRKRFSQLAMRQAMHGLLRERVGKDAFAPLQIDPPNRAIEAQCFEACLGSPDASIFRVVRRDRIQQLASDYAGGNISVRSVTWRLTGLAQWMRVNFPDWR